MASPNTLATTPNQGADKTTVYVPFGAQDEIKLSTNIVRSLIAVPTKSGRYPDDRDCLRFIMLCKARRLNPFEGDAYLLGYDTQHGPQFSLITAHQVFLKRAEASDQFDGMESGVIVMVPSDDSDNPPVLTEREGDIVMDHEKLIGGWARVFRKDRTKPMYRRLKLETFSTGRSRWEKDPAGMIVKCAEADALRSTFPSHLGDLYMADERPDIINDIPTVPAGRIGQAKMTGADMLTDAVEGELVKKQPEPTPEPTPAPRDQAEAEAPKGPSPDKLRKELMAKAREANIGKAMLEGHFGGKEAFEQLSASALQDTLDAWEDTKISILER